MAEFHYQWLETEVKLSGNLTKDTSNILWQQRHEMLQYFQSHQGEDPFMINLKELTKVDSAGLATVLALLGFLRGTTQKSSRKITLTHPPHQLIKLADANDVTGILHLAP